MNQSIDETKLTAYALGELAEPERSVVAAQIENDESARREVAAIREMAGQLKTQLTAEPMPEPARSMKVLKLPRRPRWGARLAMAAAVAGIVVAGVSFNIFTPSLHRAGEVAHRSIEVGSDLNKEKSMELSPVTIDQRTVASSIAQSEVLPKQKQMLRELAISSSIDGIGSAAPVTDLTAGKAYRGEVQYKALTPAAAPARSMAAAAEATAPFGVPSSNAENDLLARRKSHFVAGTEQQSDAKFPGTGARGEGFHFAESELNTESYDRIHDNPFLQVIQNPLSTFSIDVDTASYSNVRRFLMAGKRPPQDAVRIEELVNYFPYDYAPPAKDSADPFAANVEVASCPWNDSHRLVRVGLKAKEIAVDKRPASNLVFLLDVSGSMKPENKLPLVRRAMRMLLEQLNGEDRVAIVVYAGSSGLVLPSTTCTDANKVSVLNAISNLEAGGSTNGEQGIQLAYTVAKQNFIDGGANRVILCTDGDFNVGVTNQGDLTRIIEEKAQAGVFLSVLGFGMGNLKDSTMEKLADKGNGNYAYIDTINEAKKVLVEQMSGTLITIAKDVKIQIEFNPAVVGSYRLIGYENRMLAKEDFNDDKKDAGEIGAGHAVTALYEVVPGGATVSTSVPAVDALKYQKPAVPPRELGASSELLTLKLRYKQPDGDTSKLLEVPVTDTGGAFAKASSDFKFASAVAAFGMILRDSPHKGRASLNAVLEWAEDGVAKDPSGYRQEFVELVRKAQVVGAAK